MKSRKRDSRGYEVMRREMAILKNASEEQQRAIIRKATPEDILRMDADFETWAHENQLPPGSAGWRVWLMMAGRGFGKTRAGAEWIFALANSRPGVRIALAGATIDEARAIMVEGVSGLLSVARVRRRRLRWEPSAGKLTWPNGSEAKLFSGDNADSFRGPEHDFAWADELAKWRQAEAGWDNLELGLRRGTRPRALITTTPRPMRLLERIRDSEWSVMTTGRTSDNINLDERFVDVMTATYGGTRLGRQELDGELIEDVQGALWPREVIERSRVDAILPGTGRWQSEGLTEGAACPAKTPLHHLASPSGPPPRSGEEFDRIVVGVDPPAGVGEKSDACGIVVAGSIGDSL